jgi:hypothetical protein
MVEALRRLAPNGTRVHSTRGCVITSPTAFHSLKRSLSPALTSVPLPLPSPFRAERQLLRPCAVSLPMAPACTLLADA